METDEKKHGIERDQCIVLRAVPYAEADLILTLFSREHGRIDARAYGARSLRSQYRAACQPFCMAEFEFYIKDGRRSVKAADIRRSFFGLQQPFSRYAAASVILELTEKMLQGMDGQEADRLFRLLAVTLSALESFTGDPIYILLFFCIRAVHLLGIFPSIDTCVECGSPTHGSTKWSYISGGAVCTSCAQSTECSELPHETLACLASFGRGQPGADRDISMDRSSVHSAVRVLLDMLRHQLGIRVRAMQLLAGSGKQ